MNIIAIKKGSVSGGQNTGKLRAKEQSLLQGNILKTLISFAFPVLLALFLQAMYGAAD